MHGAYTYTRSPRALHVSRRGRAGATALALVPKGKRVSPLYR